jgi:hypothetical protein
MAAGGLRGPSRSITLQTSYSPIRNGFMTAYQCAPTATPKVRGADMEA